MFLCQEIVLGPPYDREMTSWGLETAMLGMVVMVLQRRLEQRGAYDWQKVAISLPWLCLLVRSVTCLGFAAEHEVPRYF